MLAAFGVELLSSDALARNQEGEGDQEESANTSRGDKRDSSILDDTRTASRAGSTELDHEEEGTVAAKLGFTEGYSAAGQPKFEDPSLNIKTAPGSSGAHETGGGSSGGSVQQRVHGAVLREETGSSLAGAKNEPGENNVQSVENLVADAGLLDLAVSEHVLLRLDADLDFNFNPRMPGLESIASVDLTSPVVTHVELVADTDLTVTLTHPASTNVVVKVGELNLTDTTAIKVATLEGSMPDQNLDPGKILAMFGDVSAGQTITIAGTASQVISDDQLFSNNRHTEYGIALHSERMLALADEFTGDTDRGTEIEAVTAQPDKTIATGFGEDDGALLNSAQNQITL